MYVLEALTQSTTNIKKITFFYFYYFILLELKVSHVVIPQCRVYTL